MKRWMPTLVCKHKNIYQYSRKRKARRCVSKSLTIKLDNKNNNKLLFILFYLNLTLKRQRVKRLIFRIS